MRDPHFVTTINAAEAIARNAFSVVVRNFHENRKPDNYHEIGEELLLGLQAIGCMMSINVYYLHTCSHFGEFPENLGDVSEEQGDRFHKDTKLM